LPVPIVSVRRQALRELLVRLLQGRITGGALRSVVLIGIGTALAYGTQIAIARMVGPDEFGHYAYVLGLVTIGRLVFSLSLDMAALRFVSIYFTSLDWPRIKGFFTVSRGLSLLVGSLGALLSALVVVGRREQISPSLFYPLLVGCALIVPTILLTLETAFLQSFRLVYEPRVPFNIVRPLVIIAVLFGTIIGLDVEGSAVVALTANAIGVLVALAISYVYVQKRVPGGATSLVVRRETVDWSKFCAVNLGQGVIYFALSQQADVVVVGSIIGTTESGYYSAAMQIAAVMLLAVSAVNQFIAPSLAAAGASHGDEKLTELLRRVLLLNMGLSVPLIAIVLLLGPWLLGLFGPTFLGAYPVIGVLAIGCLINAAFAGSWGDLLTMRGLYRESTTIVVIAATLNLALTVYLTPRYGIVGTAWATTTGAILRAALLCLAVRHHFGFWPWTVMLGVRRSVASPAGDGSS
jgi:O-antigen/teichoic acid export membrane protein